MLPWQWLPTERTHCVCVCDSRLHGPSGLELAHTVRLLTFGHERPGYWSIERVASH
jgi:hypothetical protein